MRVVPLPILRELLYGAPALVDLVEFYFTDQTAPDLRFALYDQDLVWSGYRYTAAGFRQPVRTRQSISDSLGELSLILPDVNATLAAMLEAEDVAGTPVLIRRVLLNRLDRNESIVFYRGRVRSPVVLEGTTASFTIAPRSSDPDDLDQVPRRRWSVPCTYQFGGEFCGVDKRTYTHSGTVAEGSNVMVIRDTSLDAAALAQLETSIGVDESGAQILSAVPASVIFESGPNIAQARPVAKVSACAIELRFPFLADPQVGDSYRIERRCPLTAEACKGFNNFDNHGGFKHQPKRPRNLLRQLVQ